MSTTATVYRPAPRYVAIAGLVFAVLFVAGLTAIRLAVPADPTDPGTWLAQPDHRARVGFALNLVPLSGIAFLWYMAALRSRIGLLEDRLFGTMFLASGWLFVAMLFASAAVSQGVLALGDEGFGVGPQVGGGKRTASAGGWPIR